MSKIIKLAEPTESPNEVNSCAIGLLREYLKLAESGKVTSVVIAAIYNDGTLAGNVATHPATHSTEMLGLIGSMETLKDDLVTRQQVLTRGFLMNTLTVPEDAWDDE